MDRRSSLAVLCGMALLAACTSLPTGPSTMALPGSKKSFEQFRQDDLDCRNYALAQVGGTSPNQAATDAGVKSAVVGAAVGAVAGAAIGGHQGAGVGAGAGVLMGSMAGVDAAQRSAYGTQQQYDNAYTQCMYAKGERVAVPAEFVGKNAQSREYTNPQPFVPPPPYGYYPPR
ncbi:MAG: glycine zipper family protein [Pseudomonadota bacterium]